MSWRMWIHPLAIFARMRRGNLYQKAQEIGCNKIALGHHFDDVIETILMNMFYGGTIETMMPKLHSRNFEGMELIRPLYHVKEADIIAWKDYHQLTFLQCACRFTEMYENQPSDLGGFKRKEVKALIGQLRETSPLIDANIFQSVQSVNLEKIISYRDGEGRHHFLEKYADGAERPQPDMVE